ncbi:trypsin-like peptidase domain-containing protein [Streptomyces sp. NPDC056600]|uniref:trypsin-like peptidase domain-containing protein n=1 Tax=Streptomyces sp. NPDC056600 TaxID=3345874 RepID=UPI003694E772
MNEGTPGKSARPKWWSRPRPAPGPDASGDFPLAAPGATGPDPAAPGPAASEPEPSGPVFSGPQPSGPVAPGPSGLGEDPGDRQAAPQAAVAPQAAAPRPLHEPDHYSTPPYGNPGPWAPAPPVQHPATPAAGTPLGGGHLPPTPPTPVPADSAAQAAPRMDPAAPAGPSADERSWTSAPPPQQPPVPAGTASGAPDPYALPAPSQQAAAPASPAGAPGPEGHAPAGAVPATPQDAAYAPAADPARSTAALAPEAHGTRAPATDAAYAPPAPDAHATRAPDPDPDLAPDPAPAGPWSRYDPWATPGAGPAAPAAPALPQGGAQGAKAPSRRRARRRRALVGGAVAVALVAGLAGGMAGVYLERHGGLGVVELSQAPVEDVPRDPDSVAGIARRALPSVVTLHVQGSGQAGTGTGFVLDDRGHILTNRHVVEAAEDAGDGRIAVTFSGGETARAELVGGDSGYDLAVVRVKGVKGLHPMPLGNSDNVRVGDPVVAIGAPFDLANTVTAGIISAKERPITAGEGDGGDVSYVDALQTDAPINPGNSGGPLLDGRGRVIGINCAIRSADTGIDTDDGKSGSIGLGFAIPVNQAKRVAEELINEGEATHPVIGVTLDMAYAGDGARVHTSGSGGGSSVTPGGPGAKAGLKAGDVITAVDGVRVHSGDELIVKTRAHRPGDRLELTVKRDGEERRITLVLGSSED